MSRCTYSIIHKVSSASTSVAAHPPNAFFPPPDTGRSSSHVHACCLYAFQERTKACLTAALRSCVCAVCRAGSDVDWTRGRLLGRPRGSVTVDSSLGGKKTLALDQSTDEGLNRTGLRDAAACGVSGSRAGDENLRSRRKNTNPKTAMGMNRESRRRASSIGGCSKDR